MGLTSSIQCHGMTLRHASGDLYYKDNQSGYVTEMPIFNAAWYIGNVVNGKCHNTGILTQITTDDNSPVNISNKSNSVQDIIDSYIDTIAKKSIPLMRSNRGVYSSRFFNHTTVHTGKFIDGTFADGTVITRQAEYAGFQEYAFKSTNDALVINLTNGN